MREEDTDTGAPIDAEEHMPRQPRTAQRRSMSAEEAAAAAEAVDAEEVAEWWDWDAAEAAGELEAEPPQPDIAQGVRMGSGGAERSEAPSAKVLGKQPITAAGASAAGASGS